MLEEVENFLLQSQAGFRWLRSTRDNILLLATLMDAILESQKTCVVTFIDFVAAFDSVSHKFLESSLFEAGASEKSRAIFKAIYEVKGKSPRDDARRRRGVQPELRGEQRGHPR